MPTATLICSLMVICWRLPCAGWWAENDREGLRHLVELDWNSDIVWQADACPAGTTIFADSPTATLRILVSSDCLMRRPSGFRVGCLARKSMATTSLVIISGKITPEGVTAWEWHCQSDMEIENFHLSHSHRAKNLRMQIQFFTLRMIAI